MINVKILLVFPFLFLMLSCGTSERAYEGARYARSSEVKVVFREKLVEDGCEVFAHVLMTSKSKANGMELARAMTEQAADRGADLVFVGLAREMADKDYDEDIFSYYGPDSPYSFTKNWMGWKFGFNHWSEGGSLVGLGVDSWGMENVTFAYPMIIQAAFLRCAK